MTSVASVTSSSTASVPPANTLDATQDRFLKLLVAQMQNQDPLNPLDNTEVTSQMAQLSTVSGINKLTELMAQFTQSSTQAQSLQAAAMIGRGVFAPGDTMTLTASGALAAVELPQSVDQLTIAIKDASGKIVHTANLGAQNAGTVTLEWDGVTDSGATAPPGSYRFEVQALAGTKAVTDAQKLAFGIVNGVTLGSSGVTLNIDGIGAIALSDVKQIL